MSLSFTSWQVDHIMPLHHWGSNELHSLEQKFVLGVLYIFSHLSLVSYIGCKHLFLDRGWHISLYILCLIGLFIEVIIALHEVIRNNTDFLCTLPSLPQWYYFVKLRYDITTWIVTLIQFTAFIQYVPVLLAYTCVCVYISFYKILSYMWFLIFITTVKNLTNTIKIIFPVAFT